MAKVAQEPVSCGANRVISPSPPIAIVSTGVLGYRVVIVQVAVMSSSTSPVEWGITAAFTTSKPRSCIAVRRVTSSAADGVAEKSWTLPITGIPAALAAASTAFPAAWSKRCSTSTASTRAEVMTAMFSSR